MATRLKTGSLTDRKFDDNAQIGSYGAHSGGSKPSSSDFLRKYIFAQYLLSFKQIYVKLPT